jgi:hypothetical protein
MKLQYNISFIENVQDFNGIDDNDFRLIKGDLKRKLYNYMTYAGFEIDGEIKLEFDMIGDDGIETW